MSNDKVLVSRLTLDCALDCLERCQTQAFQSCECEQCHECGLMPDECSGTECAKTCQCRTCEHCLNEDSIKAIRALLAEPNTGTKDGDPVHASEPVWLWTAPDGHFSWTDRWDVAKHLPFELTKLYRNPPAQAPVVLPERMEYQKFGTVPVISDAEVERWNACIDETKRLNPTL